jgi:AcrR family transcriptional regulator
VDPRSARTRRSLQQALLELAHDRPLDDITVGDIAERAEVNRSSFYQHYTDKDALLADALDVAIEATGAGLPEIIEPSEGPPPALLEYLSHIDANAALYRRALGDHGSPAVMARLRARIEQIIRDAIGRSPAGGFEGVPVDIVAAGIAGSALGVVEAWLALDPRPPVETAVDWLWRVLLGPGAGWGP